MTKAFDQLTEAELVALSENDIQRYIDLACAEDGVALLPELPEKPPTKAVPDDLTVYEVAGMLFFDAGEANEVAAAINLARTRVLAKYISGPSYRRTVEPAVDPVNVTSLQILRPETAAQMRALIEAHEAEVKRYNELKTAHDKITRARESHANAIRSKVEDAWSLHRRREQRGRDYARYLELAEGNQAVAMRFLDKAYSDARELLAELPWDTLMAWERKPEPVGVPDDIEF